MRWKRKLQTGKTALVLAGGGLTGAVYEIGALRAIDDLLVDRTVNDFDIYVGTSAGSLVGACLANGLTPHELMQVFDASHPEIEPVKQRHIFNFNTGEFVRKTIELPQVLAMAWTQYLRQFHDMTLFDFLWSLFEALPSAMYDGRALEEYVRKALTDAGRSDDFRQLQRALYIIATDLDSGERVVFGPGETEDVPISQAVSASSALPLVYKPVRIGGRELVDGSLRGTASLDVAIEKGATLVICINPMVPFDNRGQRVGGHLSKRGVRAIASQITRITVQAGLHYHIKQLRRAYPEVDIILIEPRPDDYEMFFHNIMRYSVRQAIAEHGYETVTLGLAENHNYYEQILSRHNIPTTRRVALSELAEIRAAEYDPAAIRRVMERRLHAEKGRNGKPAIGRLKETLAELELSLETMIPGGR